MIRRAVCLLGAAWAACGAWADAPVLTYNGATKGNWFDAGVWLNASGSATSWQDGAIAVITNKEITLNGDAFVYGFNVYMTGRYCVYGTGKLTVGAGGITKNGAAGEFNIQNSGGLVLSDSQLWNTPAGGMICLDGMRSLTASNGVVLSGLGGATCLRMNTAGGLSANTTVYVSTNAFLSQSSGTYLSGGLLILDGPGNRLVADSGYTLGSGRLAGRLILRNGASVSLSGTATLTLPTIEADAPATQAVSTISGASMALGCATTEFAVSNGAAVQLSVPLANVSGTNAVLRKTGSGALWLNAASTFSGGVLADAGVVRVLNASGAGTGAVTVASGALLDLAATGVFSNAVAGAGGLVKSANGSLSLPAANTFSGGALLSNGATRVASAASLGPGAVTLTNGASLVFASSQTVSSADVARISGTGSVLAGVGADVVWSGTYAVPCALALDAEAGGTLEVGQLTGSGYTKTGAGKLRIAGTAGYSGEIVVNAGVLEIDSTTNLAAGVTVRTAGSGVVQLDALSGQDLTKITGTCAVALNAGTTNALNTDTLSVTLTTVTNETYTISGLTGSADLVKTGPGTLAVTNAASFAGNVRVLQGTLRAIGALGGGTVTVSNGVFAAYGAGTTLLNAFTVAGGTLLADAGGSLGAGSIALLSGGTLAATNAGSLGSGSLLVTNATLRMDAGGSAGTRAITTVSGGLIQVYDGAGFNSATMTLGGGTLSFLATTAVNCALPLTANSTIGATAPAVGTLGGVVSGGKKLIVNGSGRLLMAGGGTSIGEIFVQGSGDFTVVSNLVTVTGYAGLESGGKRFAVADGGTFSMTGNNVNLHAGMGGGDCTFEVLTGGVYNVSAGVNLLVGNGGNTTFRVRGGTVNVANGGQFLLGNLSTMATGTVELAAGGVLKSSRQFATGTGTGTLLLTGGTLQSDGANSYDPWIATNIAVTVGSAGGTVNAQGLDMKLGSAGIAGSGTLAVAGGGSLLFSQPSTNWAGGLSLVQGSAVVATNRALGTSAVSLGTNTLRVAASAFLPNAVAASALGGAVSVDAGATGAIASVAGGLLVKRGDGGLLADDVAEGADVSIQGGRLIVTPVDGMSHVPAGTPAIWVDATVAASFVTAASNDVSRWYDRRTPGDATGFFATNLYNRPLIVSNRVSGLPTLDFGVLGQGGSGDNRMMGFKNYQTNIRTVFWVIGSKNGGGFLLGDSQVDGSMRHFHRSSGSGTYGGVPSDPLWGGAGQDKGLVRNGETWTNGVSVNGATTGLSGDYDLVTWRLAAADDATNGTPGACWFASCYAPTDGRLNGGQELGEVLIYTNRLSDAEVKATERYLSRKWFPTRYGSRLAFRTVSLDGAGAGFVNAYTGLVQVATLSVNGTNVFVSGAAGGTTVSQAVVTASGVLGPSVARALALGSLTLQNAATLEAAFSPSGTVYTVSAGGSVLLPAAARFVVTGTAAPPPTALLAQASNSVAYASEKTVWSNAGGVSRGSYVLVDTAAGKIWLKTPRGTAVIVR